MRMAKLRVTRIPHRALIQRATVMQRSITKNAELLALPPTLRPRLAEALTPFATARQEVTRLKLELLKWEATSRSCRKDLEWQMGVVAVHVNNRARGRTGIIHAAGIPATRIRRPVHMTKVLSLRVTPSVKEGELLAAWKPVHRKCFYEVQTSSAALPGESAWENRWAGSRSWCSLNGDLQSGERILVRVRALGTNGSGPWSDPLRKTVP